MKIDKRLVPSLNIGVFGHVSHGKTTLVAAITGKVTLRHSEELKRGITIRLGYADTRIYRCKSCGKYLTSDKCVYCFSEDVEIVKTISFIDSPGHESLMSTAITGASIIDGALFVIAANEKCPQPQTREHLAALEASKIKNVIFIQNKIDLVSKERALESYNEIKEFLKGTIYEDNPIIPISAQQKINIDKVLEAIVELIQEKKGEDAKNLKIYVVRSFDINKPGTRIKEVVGGVIGGSIVRGIAKINSEIIILPGVKLNGGYNPLETEIVNIKKFDLNLEEAGPGGLAGILTSLDPSLTKSDNLAGNVVFDSKNYVELTYELRFNYKLLERVIGDVDLRRVEPLKINENILLNVGVSKTISRITSIKNDEVEVKLVIPVCVEKGEKVTISRLINGRWRLIGYGEVKV